MTGPDWSPEGCDSSESMDYHHTRKKTEPDSKGCSFCVKVSLTTVFCPLNLCVRGYFFLPWLGWPPAPKQQLQCVTSVVLHLAHPNSFFTASIEFCSEFCYVVTSCICFSVLD